MKPAINSTGHISAQCPQCGVSNFELKGALIAEGGHPYDNRNWQQLSYTFHQCSRCHRGALAKVHNNGNYAGAEVEEFFPFAIEQAILPNSVPEDIVKEFREAELCASFRAYRAASALFRSVLEKTLKVSGYTTGTLESRIDTAATDGVITETRAQRAHDEIRVLGNDVLHDAWREVTEDEVALTRHYAQRVLEDLYDDRASIEQKLIAKGRLSPPAISPTPTASTP